MSDKNTADTQPVPVDHQSVPRSNTSTQPVRVNNALPPDEPPEPSETQRTKVDHSPVRQSFNRWLWGVVVVLLIFLAMISGSFAGYRSAKRSQALIELAQGDQTLLEQFQLGVQDLKEGRYEVARQRFDFIITKDPTYPGAAEKLFQVIQILYATSTPTAIPPTVAPTPTPDLRPIQELFVQAQALASNQDWNGAIETLISLRKADAAYQVAEVDGLLYLALRNRGVRKILDEGSLESGSYDLNLAENFGPLDKEALSVREVARIYMIGSSFWEAFPEQAVYYFAQVAAAAPYLRDASGWTALDRYRGALIQYGDQLARQGSWCLAQTQYELALAIRADDSLLNTLKEVIERCSPATATVSSTFTLTPTWTLTPTITFPFFGTVTPTPTATFIFPSETPSPTWTVSPPEITPTPTDTPEPPTPTPTDTPPPPDVPTETPKP